MSTPPSTRRVTIDLHKPRFAPYFGLRPTIVIEGRSQPTQWGVGTWQLPADRETEVQVFLFRLGMTSGRARATLRATDLPTLRYRAPWFPALAGRFE